MTIEALPFGSRLNGFSSRLNGFVTFATSWFHHPS
jgi:hypothetical protein